jgi:fructose-bisphosphate aldolase class 1
LFIVFIRSVVIVCLANDLVPIVDVDHYLSTNKSRNEYVYKVLSSTYLNQLEHNSNCIYHTKIALAFTLRRLYSE